jgi:hypothetical protein
LQVTYLPGETVQFLNAFYRYEAIGHDAFMAFQEQYRGFCATARAWLERRKELSLSDEENVLIENISYLFERRDELRAASAVSRGDLRLLGKLAKVEADTAQSLKSLNDMREQARLLPVEMANDFLLAAWTHLHRQTPYAVLSEYYSMLSGYHERLLRDYCAHAALLRPEVTEQFRYAFELAGHGLHDVYSYLASGERALLEAGASRVKDAYGLLHHYLEWKKESDEKLRSELAPYAVPQLAPDFQMLLEEACAGRLDSWAEKVDFVRSDPLEKLLHFWQQARERLFVKPSKKEVLVVSMDGWLAELERRLMALRSYSPEAAGAYEESLHALLQVMGALDHETIRWNHLHFPLVEPLGEMVRGIYYGILPDMNVDELLLALKGENPLRSFFDEARVFLEEFQQGGDREQLLSGLEKFLDALPDREEVAAEATTQIPCPCCGTLNDASRTGCHFCGTRFSGSSQSLNVTQLAGHAMDPFFMPLPPAAEPLVRLLKQAERGQCTPDSAVSLLDEYTRSVDATEVQFQKDKSLPAQFRESMADVLQSLREADQEARSFLDSHDPAVLRRALVKISAAAVQVGSV